MDKELAKYIEALKDPDWKVRLKAVSALGALREEEAVRALLTVTKDENEYVRKEVIPALGNIGSLAKIAVPFLVEKVFDKDIEISKSAVYTIGKIGIHAMEALPVLIDALSLGNEEYKSSVSWALSMLAAEAIEPLINCLQDENPQIRSGVAEALGRAALEADLTVPALIPLLRDKVATVRIASAKALGNMRAAKKAEDAVPYLIQALKDEDPDVAWLSSEALRKIATQEALDAWANYEPDGSVPKLIKQLRNKDKSIRADAARVLRDLSSGLSPSAVNVHGEQAKDAVEALTYSLRDQMWNVKSFSAEALGRIGKDALSAESALINILNDTDVRVRKSAITALGKIKAETAVEKLIPLLKDPAREIRNATAIALEDIDTLDAKAALKGYEWE